MRPRIAIALVVSAIAAPIFARPARAYVRAVSQSGAPLYWPGSCAAVTIYLNGFSGLTSDEVAKSIAAAAHAWSPAAVTCPDPGGDGGSGHPYFEVIPALSAGGPVPSAPVNDGRNSIVFPTVWNEDPEAIALTSHFNRPDGELLDADMEINPAPNAGNWANLDPGAPPGRNGQDLFDLQTAITHEFGHFIGLAHTCFTSTDPSIPSDDHGQPIPSCDDTGAPEAQAVMWYQVDPNSTTKRVITPDDARGICDIYPAAKDPHACPLNLPDDGCGCATAAGPVARGAAPGLLAFALAVAHARRRRRLRSDPDRRAAL